MSAIAYALCIVMHKAALKSQVTLCRLPLQNFDDVLVPVDHVSRSPNDTYYIDKQTVRPVGQTHTTAADHFDPQETSVAHK